MLDTSKGSPKGRRPSVHIKRSDGIKSLPSARVFINTLPPRAENVRHRALAVPGVLTADFVFGSYDIICPIRATDIADLERTVVHLQTQVPGITRTTTCLVKEVF